MCQWCVWFNESFLIIKKNIYTLYTELRVRFCIPGKPFLSWSSSSSLLLFIFGTLRARKTVCTIHHNTHGIYIYLRYNDNNNKFSRKGHVKIFRSHFIRPTLNMQLLFFFYSVSSASRRNPGPTTPDTNVARSHRLCKRRIYMEKKSERNT